MSKKKKGKDISKLRAQVEFLKAQLKTRPATGSWLEAAPPRAPEQSSTLVKAKEVGTYQLNPALLREDLRKTFLLTFLVGLLLAVAYLTQNYWSLINSVALKMLKRG